MAQNNMMGGGMVPPPASPANPTALNFQSDPNMRQQFKGFMSGLSNRPMPQPMAQPMPSPMPMYTPASNIDIFEPVQGFANGGGVSFSSGSDYSPGDGISISSSTVQGDDTFGGRNDRRDSSGLNDPYEAEMIQTGKSFLDSFSPSSGGDSDGPVAFGIGSRPRVDLTGRSSPVVDALSNEIGKRSNQTGYDDAPMNSRGMLTNQAQADAAMGLGRGFGASGTAQSVRGAPTASGYDEFGFDTLNLLGNVDLLDSDAVMRQALDSTARFMQDANGQVFVNEEMTGLPGGAAVVSGRPLQTIDEIMYNDTMMNTDMSPADMQRVQRERAAQDITRRGGTVDVNPDTGQLIANYPQTPSMLDTVPQSMSAPIDMPDEIRSMRNTFNDLDVFGPNVDGAPVTIATPESRPSSFERGKAAGERVSLGLPVGGGIDEDLVDYTPLADARQEFDTKGARAPADQGFFGALMDTITGREYPTDAQKTQGIVDASNRRTDITLGTGAKDLSALDQLAMRAGMSPGSASGQMSALGPLGAIAGKFGASNAGQMYQDIVNNGYEPVYDSRGQIIQTRVPGTNILGKGSRPNNDFTGDDGGDIQAPMPIVAPAEEVAEVINALGATGTTPATPATTPPATAPTPQTPTPLARPLGFGFGQIQGINPNLDNAANKFLSLLGGFAEGGEVKKFAKGGAAGDDLDAFGGAGPDVGFEGSGRGTFSGGSYSENPFDSGGDDDYVAPTVAPNTFIDQGGTKISTDVANQMNQQAKKDKAARDALEATNLQQQQQQTAPQNMIQTQAGPIDPASMSMGEKMSLIGEGLGNLLDVDLFSSNAPTVDTEMAARMQAAGFSPVAANRVATSSGGIFDVQKTAPTPASVTDYKNYRTTTDNKINMGPVDMSNNRGFDFSGIGDMFGRAIDYVSNVDVMGNKIDTSSFGGYSK